MITGEVRENWEATIRLVLSGPTGRSVEVESVIDTGFTDYVTLPREVVNALAIRYSQSMDFELADGEVAMFDLYECSLLWNGVLRQVLATVTEGGSLVGMSLLEGNRLVMDVLHGGLVTIDSLP